MKLKYFLFLMFMFSTSTVSSAPISDAYTGKINFIIIPTITSGQIGTKYNALVILEGGIGRSDPLCSKILLPDGTESLGFALPANDPTLDPNQSKTIIAGLMAAKLNGTPVTIVSTTRVNIFCQIDHIYF